MEGLRMAYDPCATVLALWSGILQLVLVMLFFIHTLVLVVTICLVNCFALKIPCMHCPRSHFRPSSTVFGDGISPLTAVEDESSGLLKDEDLSVQMNSSFNPLRRTCSGLSRGHGWACSEACSIQNCKYVDRVEILNVDKRLSEQGRRSLLRRRNRNNEELLSGMSNASSRSPESKSDVILSPQYSKIIDAGFCAPSEEVEEDRKPTDESFEMNERNGLEEVVTLLRRALKIEREALRSLCTELEEERNAAETAANEAMAMILRLQEEKAALKLEAAHYQRMMEEKSIHDEQAIQLLQEYLCKMVGVNRAIEEELNILRSPQIEEGIVKLQGEMLLLTHKEVNAPVMSEVDLVDGSTDVIPAIHSVHSDEPSTPQNFYLKGPLISNIDEPLARQSRPFLLTNKVEEFSSLTPEIQGYDHSIASSGKLLSAVMELVVEETVEKERVEEEVVEGSSTVDDICVAEPAYKRLKEFCVEDKGDISNMLISSDINGSHNTLFELVGNDIDETVKAVIDQLYTTEEQLQVYGSMGAVYSWHFCGETPLKIWDHYQHHPSSLDINVPYLNDCNICLGMIKEGHADCFGTDVQGSGGCMMSIKEEPEECFHTNVPCLNRGDMCVTRLREYLREAPDYVHEDSVKDSVKSISTDSLNSSAGSYDLRNLGLQEAFSLHKLEEAGEIDRLSISGRSKLALQNDERQLLGQLRSDEISANTVLQQLQETMGGTQKGATTGKS